MADVAPRPEMEFIALWVIGVELPLKFIPNDLFEITVLVMTFAWWYFTRSSLVDHLEGQPPRRRDLIAACWLIILVRAFYTTFLVPSPPADSPPPIELDKGAGSD